MSDEAATRSRTLAALLASTAVLPLGVPMLSPVLPAIRDAFGLGDPVTSLVMTVYYLPAVALSPLLGVAIDRVGRRAMLVPAMLVWATAGLVIASAPTFEVVLLMRVIHGAAAATVLIVTVTLIGDVYDGVERNTILGANFAVLFGSSAVVPLVGGVLVEDGWNVPFLVFAVGFPVALFAFVAIVEPDRPVPRGGIAYLRGAVDALPGLPALGLYGAAFLAEFAMFGSILTALPFLLSDSFGAMPVVVGAVISASTLVIATVSASNGWFARRLPNRWLIVAGFVVLGGSLLAFQVADSPLRFGVVAALFGVGSGLILPSVDASIASLTEATYRGGALSLRNSATFLGRGTGPVAFTLAAGVTGYLPLMAAVGGSLLVLALISAAVVARRPADDAAA